MGTHCLGVAWSKVLTNISLCLISLGRIKLTFETAGLGLLVSQGGTKSEDEREPDMRLHRGTWPGTGGQR